MNFKYYLHRLLSLSPNEAFKKGTGKLWRKLSSLYQRQQDTKSSTHVKLLPSNGGKLHSYFSPVSIDLLRAQADQLAELANHYLAHRFDLLGSGWVQVKHGMGCRGLEGYRYDMGSPVQPDSEGRWLQGRINPANLAESQRIWRLVDMGYIPIDWHLDFKSGYRWSEDIWYLQVPYGHKLGADIKVPWELARMQHLPQLAHVYALAMKEQTDLAAPHIWVREFRNQVLDFIATNPPRFGVNWRCAMDVGIRVANWLVAYDLFRASGAEFDAEFEVEFCRSLYEHGLHIINNLEWLPEHRTNHYLANIAGLLFVAAYLPRTPIADAWLAFAVQELIAEVEYQFYPDGANFEASTSYHRLSAEMVVYATALVLGLSPEKQAALQEYGHHPHKVRPALKPAPLALYTLAGGDDRRTPFPDWYIERLEKMAEFTAHITKPNGHIPQIGDNDSGRFLKLQPLYDKMTVAEAKVRYANLNDYTDLPDDDTYLDELILDHRHLLAAINGLFSRDDFAALTGTGWPETELVRGLAGCVPLGSYRQLGELTAAERLCIGTEEDWMQLHAELDSLPEDQRQVLEIAIPGEDLAEGLNLYAYPDFGLYIYRSKRFYLAVRCGQIGQNGIGGHAHNDQFSVELNVDGEDWITDPGTYLYTPLPERRNQYRSVKAHWGPQLEGWEPEPLDLGLFRLGNQTSAKCLYCGQQRFWGVLESRDMQFHRKIIIKNDRLSIRDFYKVNKGFMFENRYRSPVDIKLSVGYGKVYSQKLFQNLKR